MKNNIVLIDSNLKDTNVLLSSLNAETLGIVYNYSTSRNAILHQIEDEFGGKTVSRVAICCHGGESRFLENGTFFDVDGSTNEILKNANSQFILDLLETYNVSNIDYLACNSLKYDSWKHYYDFIESQSEGVTVGASEDDTGNIKYGGNWIMENTGEQIDNIYFNEGLEYYTYLFTNNEIDTNSYYTARSFQMVKTGTEATGWSASIVLYDIKIYDQDDNNIITPSSTSSQDGIFSPVTRAHDDDLSTSSNTGGDGLYFKIFFSEDTQIKKINIRQWFNANDFGTFFGNYKLRLCDVNENTVYEFATPTNMTFVGNKTHDYEYLFVLPPSLNPFTIDPSYITIKNNPAIINMTFNFAMTASDISSNLNLTPSDCGTISNITNTSGTNIWTADFTPIYNTDCSLRFNITTPYSIDETINFSINIPPPTTIEIQLSPPQFVQDLSSTLQLTFDNAVYESPVITIDPSNVAFLDGSMVDISAGLVWSGTITNFAGMYGQNNILTATVGDLSGQISFNIISIYGTPTLITSNDGTTFVSSPFSNKVELYDSSGNFQTTILSLSGEVEGNIIGGIAVNFTENLIAIGLPENSENKNIKTFHFDGTEVYNVNNKYISGTNLGTFVHLSEDNKLTVSNDVSANEFQLSEYTTYIELEHNITNISTISNIEYPDVSTNFAIQFTTNDVSLVVLESKLSVDPSNVANITNTTLTNYGFTLEGQLDVSGEHNVSGVKLFYEDFSSNAFDIYSIQDLSINEFSFDISSAVTYETYISNNITITLTLNRSDLTNVDISNSLTLDPSNCGQIVNVSGSEYTRTITFTPTLYINEPDCSLTFHYTQTEPYLDASMTIPFSVDTEQQIIDASLNPKGIFGGTNTVSNFGVKFRLPVETPGTAPDITISPSYIARIDSISALSVGSDTWTGVIHRNLDKNRLYNNIDFSYNGLDISLNFNVAQNPELIVGPREIGDFVECKGIKITSTSDDDFTIKEVEIIDENGLITHSSVFFFENSQSTGSDLIMDGNNSNITTVSNFGEKWFQIVFNSNKKIKEITIYASHSVKIELLGEAPNYNVITNLGQVNVDVSGTINIANASTQSTITREVIDISLNPSNIVYPDMSSNFEMLFSTNIVSLLDISNTYLSFDPSNAANLTNLSLIDNDYKLIGQIEANEKIFIEDCKLKYDETDISGEKQLAIKDLFIRSSSIVPKTTGVSSSSINFEHNVGILELEFTLIKPDLSINDFVLDNSASISNLTKDGVGLIWRADITFPYTDLDVSVNYDISVNYKPSDSYLIRKTYNTYIPIVGDKNLLEIYDKVPDPDPDQTINDFDVSLGDTTTLGAGTNKRGKRGKFIERLLETYKNKLKNTTEKLVMKTKELLGDNSGITKEKIKILDNFDTNGNKLSDISFKTNTLSGDEAVYVPLEEIGYSITLDTYSLKKLKIEKISDTSFNVYENYDNSNPIITKVMTYDETGIYDFFQYKIGTVEGENVPAITNITLNPSNLISDLSSNLQVTFSQPTSQPIITIDPSYIAYLDGSMTSVDDYIWSGTLNRTLEMNRLNNILTVSGEYDVSNISFNVVENSSLIKPSEYVEFGSQTTNYIEKIICSSNGSNIVGVKTNDNNVKLYYLNGSIWTTFGTYATSGRSFELSDDGSVFVHNYNTSSVRIYSINTESHSLTLNKTINGDYIALSGDGSNVFIKTGSNVCEVYDNSGNSLDTRKTTTTSSIFGIHVSYTGNRVVYNVSETKFEVYDLSGTEYVLYHTINDTNISRDIGLTSLSGNGDILVYRTNNSPTSYNLKIYNLKKKQFIKNTSSSSNFFGNTLKTNYDGNIVAHTENSGTNNVGITKVIKYNGINWYDFQTFVGTIGRYQGQYLSLSSDANLLILSRRSSNQFASFEFKEEHIIRQLTSTTLTPSDIIYPDSSSNFEVLFTTNDKTLDDISGNLSLVSSIANVNLNLTNLQLAHSGFKLVGNIEAPPLSKSLTNNLRYYESEDVSGESNPFSIYTYPPFQLVNFGLTPENIVGPDDVSSNLQIEFNIPIDNSLNNYITIDPSYIVNLDTMTTIDGGYTWSGAVSRELYMNKLGNKLEFNYTDINLSDLSDNAFTASAELLFDVLESKNVLKWEKKTDTSLNETFNETVEISPNGQILAQIGTSNSAKIYHLQSDSTTWGNVKTYSSANHLALCDNRIAIATSSGVDVYEYDSSWSQIGNSIIATNVSNLDISIDGNRVAYVYDVSVGIQEYTGSSWTPMTMTEPIIGNNVKFSPNGSLLGIGTLDSENQNFSNVVLYEYDGSSWNLKP